MECSILCVLCPVTFRSLLMNHFCYLSFCLLFLYVKGKHFYRIFLLCTLHHAKSFQFKKFNWTPSIGPASPPPTLREEIDAVTSCRGGGSWRWQETDPVELSGYSQCFWGQTNFCAPSPAKRSMVESIQTYSLVPRPHFSKRGLGTRLIQTMNGAQLYKRTHKFQKLSSICAWWAATFASKDSPLVAS